MSLMKTLAKVAIGVAVAKGVGKMMKGGQRRRGSGGMFGGANSPDRAGAGLEDIMGDILGGRKGGGSAGSGGLGGLLDQLGGGGSGGRGRSGGGLDDLIGGLASGGLGGLLGGAVAKRETKSSGGGTFSDALNQSFGRRDEPAAPPSADQEAVAGLMLKAMIQAAKADGKVDEKERAKLLDQLGDVSPEERAFVQREFEAPIDVDGLARLVPRGLEQQVYAMSVIGINLDDQNEAQYLHDLATKMGISQAQVNHIHEQIGAPALYA